MDVPLFVMEPLLGKFALRMRSPLLSIAPALLDPVAPIVIRLSLSISENSWLKRNPVSAVVIFPVVTLLLITPSVRSSAPNPLVREPELVIAIVPKLSIIPALAIVPVLARVNVLATSMDVPVPLLAMEPLLSKFASMSMVPLAVVMEPLLSKLASTSMVPLLAMEPVEVLE